MRRCLYVVTTLVALLVAHDPNARARTLGEPLQGARLELIGQLGGASAAVAMIDNMALLGAGPRVHTLDMSSLRHAVPLSQSAIFTDTVRAMTLSGRRAYVAVGAAGLVILELGESGELTTLGRVLLTEPALDVVVDGNHAYIALGDGGAAVVDVSRPATPRVVALAATELPVLRVAVRDRLVYGATGAADGHGIVAIDITVPVSPTVATIFGPSSRDLKVVDSTLYVAGSEGAHALAITEAITPTVLGSWTEAAARALTVAGTQAFVALAEGDVVELDFADPTAPAATARIATDGWVADLAVGPERLVVAHNRGSAALDLYAQGGGLQLWDLSPATPVQRLTLDLPSGVWHDMELAGDVILAAEGGGATPGRAWAIDVARPSMPFPRGATTTAGQPTSVAARTPFGFVASEGGFLVVDWSVPTLLRPALRASQPNLAGAGLAVADHLLYAVGAGALAVYDISSPTQPRLIPPRAVPSFGGASALALGPERAFVAGEDGLAILDVRVPGWPRTLARLVEAGPASDVRATANIVYVADRREGLHVIDARRTAAIGVAATLPGAGLVALDVTGRLLFMVHRDGAVELVDVIDPQLPVTVAHAEPPEVAGQAGPQVTTAVARAAGDLVFVARPDIGLLVYRATGDIPPPPPPVPTATTPPANQTAYLPLTANEGLVGGASPTFRRLSTRQPINTHAHGLALAEGNVVVGQLTSRDSWLEVVDATDPNRPALLGRTAALPGEPRQLAAAGQHIVVAMGTAGMGVVDISAPAAPILVGHATTFGSVVAVATHGRLAFAAEQHPGQPSVLKVFDIANPAALQELGAVDIVAAGTVTALTTGAGSVFVAVPEDGVIAVDVSSPSNPRASARFALPGATGALLDGVLLYAVNRGAGNFPAGLWTLSWRGVESPLEVGALVNLDWPEAAGATKVARAGRYAFMASADSLRAVDVSLPEWPRRVADWDEAFDEIRGLTANQTHIFITDNRHGLTVATFGP